MNVSPPPPGRRNFLLYRTAVQQVNPGEGQVLQLLSLSSSVVAEMVQKQLQNKKGEKNNSTWPPLRMITSFTAGALQISSH